MRDIIQELNKASLASATGISYSRLRKYASGIVEQLSQEEMQKIAEYLKRSAEIFEQERLKCEKNGNQLLV